MLTKQEIDKIKSELRHVLQNNEKIEDVLEGFYSGIKVKSSKADEGGGILFLSNKRLFFLTIEDEQKMFEEISFKDLLSFHVDKAGDYNEITMEVKDHSILFKTTDNEECVGNFSRRLKAAIEARKEKVVFYDYSSNYDFLTLEARKILLSLEDYFNKNNREFCRVLVDDLITAAFLVIRSKKLLNEKEIFFMTLTLLPLHQQIPDKDQQEILDIINNFDLAHVQAVNRYWPKIARFFPENIKEDITSFLSLDYLIEIDKDNGSNHHDKIRTLFFNFVQCLIKADGRITESEIEIEEKLNGIIFQKHKVSLTEKGPAKKKAPVKKELSKKKLKQKPAEEQETLESVMKKINDLVGMKNIKKEINTLVNLIKIRKAREERGLPVSKTSLHAVFYGPPGTGKTTIARLLGKVYKTMGLLTKGHIIETDRAGLVAGYVGQTAIQVNEVVEQALDGILFIDEAYALKPRGGSGNDFGQEAIETILKRMEDQRERLVVIVAGYPDEMKEFIESNPGLKSRFSRYFYFKDYKPEELIKIFAIFCKNAAYKITKHARTKLLELLKTLYAEKDRTFGNGRLVRNIFEKVIENQANRLVKITPLTEEILSTIQKADVPTRKELEDRSPIIK
ncbi:MAG: AAA family ATPase [Spirochaetales bacterium]|nr:AAA family ATPase [Spirochaetales bacterium]